MKNKKMLIKLGTLAVIIGCFSLSFTSAITFHLRDIPEIENLSQEYLSDKIIPIHFADNGNDFGGFFYFSDGIIQDEEEPNPGNGGEVSGDEGEGDEGGDEEEIVDDEISGDIFGVSIGNGNNEYECSKQVKGFYYNAERGERLRPLDQETQNNFSLRNGLETTGGFYTMCNKSGYVAALQICLNKAAGEEHIDYGSCKNGARETFATPGNGYYGYIKHTYSGQEMGLIAGVEYNPGSNPFISIKEKFSPSFVRIGNKYPAGFIYDYNGGVGFIGCHVKTSDSVKNILENYNKLLSDGEINPLNELFYESGYEMAYKDIDSPGYNANIDVDCSDAVRDSLIGIVIEGIVGMGESGNKADFGVIGNQMDKKMQYFSSADINNNTIINYARKKAELLCRGKWKGPGPTAINLQSNDIICIDGNGSTIRVEDSKKTKENRKTLIVRNGNVEVAPFGNPNDNNYYDIFIDSGNLIIKETEGNSKFVFNNNGFISDTTVENFNSNVSTALGESHYDGNDVAIGVFIKGNFIVDGHIKSSDEGSGLNNKYFIYGKISTRDTFNSLLETFNRRCINGLATDGAPCPPSHKNGENKRINPYENASLVVIDQNYKSPFFNES